MPRLSDPEKQEIIRFIEAGKPLPEKYRFLLFDDKREVELVWNGKTGEVCNIVLPFQIIEQVDEPRAEKPEDTKPIDPLFQWGGISLDARGRQLKGWTNKLIWGDNKLILSSLKNGPLREEVWTGDYIFENEWQSFRTKKDRSLELKSIFHECTAGRRKIAVKVVDIFGNDTMTIVDVSVGGKTGGTK